jgi:hypothetical protein
MNTDQKREGGYVMIEMDYQQLYLDRLEQERLWIGRAWRLMVLAIALSMMFFYQ